MGPMMGQSSYKNALFKKTCKLSFLSTDCRFTMMVIKCTVSLTDMTKARLRLEQILGNQYFCWNKPVMSHNNYWLPLWCMDTCLCTMTFYFFVFIMLLLLAFQNPRLAPSPKEKVSPVQMNSFTYIRCMNIYFISSFHRIL